MTSSTRTPSRRSLTFFLDDIDRGTGYHDYVGLASTPAEVPGSAPGSSITGSGTFADGWRTTAQSGDYSAAQTVKVTYANGLLGITALSLRLWSTATPLISTAHLTRVRQMQFRTCA